MRHGKKINHLGRKKQHRVLMLRNMASSLIIHKRIKTTLAKAKALRRYVEPLITRGKVNSTHNRRMCFRNLQQKEAVTELFTDVAAKVGDRPGGYTRIVRIGTRYGDNAEMCIIELVDYNEVYTTERKVSTGKKKTRRRRGGGAKATAAAATAAAAAETVEETVTETAEDRVEEVVEDVTPEEVVEEVEQAATAEEVFEDVQQSTEEVVEEVQPAAEEVVEETTAAVEDNTEEPAAEEEPPAAEPDEEQES